MLVQLRMLRSERGPARLSEYQDLLHFANLLHEESQLNLQNLMSLNQPDCMRKTMKEKYRTLWRGPRHGGGRPRQRPAQ